MPLVVLWLLLLALRLMRVLCLVVFVSLLLVYMLLRLTPSVYGALSCLGKIETIFVTPSIPSCPRPAIIHLDGCGLFSVRAEGF